MDDPRTAAARARIGAAVTATLAQLRAAQLAKGPRGKFDHVPRGSVASAPELAVHEYEGRRGRTRYVGMFLELTWQAAGGTTYRYTENVEGPETDHSQPWRVLPDGEA